MKDSRYSLWFCVVMTFVIFTFLVTLGSLEEVFGFSRRPGNFWNDFWRGFWGWNSWVPTVPVAYWLVQKHLDGKNKNWQLILFIILGTVIVIMYKAVFLELFFSSPQRHRESFSIWKFILWSLIDRRSIIEAIIFWFILATIFALQYSRLLQVRDEQEQLLKTELAQAQLNALKIQLQPHFLFNTLNSISSLLREKVEPTQLHANMQAADGMLTNLSEMFRHTLTTANVHVIPLRDELAFLENYLEIEKVRFAEKLTIQMDIDPKLNSIEVPAFILQPIVENAIRHGTSKQSQPGLIQINIHERNGSMEICITDNGNCTEQDLKNVFEKGVGLQNTKKRLYHLYGEQFTFSIGKNSDNQTQVDIVFPVELPKIKPVEDKP